MKRRGKEERREKGEEKTGREKREKEKTGKENRDEIMGEEEGGKKRESRG